MKKQAQLILCCATIAALTPVAASAATSFGINFNPQPGEGVMLGHDGLLGAQEWRDFDGPTGTATITTTLTLTGGQSFGLTYSASGFYDNGYGNTYGDGSTTFFAGAAYKGYLDDNGAGVRVTLTGLSDWMNAENLSGYTIKVLRSTDASKTDPGATFLPVKIYSSEGGSLLDTLAVQADGSDIFNGSFDGYQVRQTPYYGMRATNASSQSFTNDSLFLSTDARSGNARGAVAAIIITGVPIPEPSTYALFGGIACAGIALLAARRRKRG